MTADDFKHTAQAINDYGAKVIELYRGHLENAGYTDGKLYNTISSSVSKEGSTWVVTINLEDYWKYIENGRQAGSKMPPVTAIENWINYKRILPRPIQLSSGKTVIPTVKQLAFVIARAIGRDGIPAKKYMEQTIEQVNEQYKQIIIDAIQEDFNEIFKQ